MSRRYARVIAVALLGAACARGGSGAGSDTLGVDSGDAVPPAGVQVPPPVESTAARTPSATTPETGTASTGSRPSRPSTGSAAGPPAPPPAAPAGTAAADTVRGIVAVVGSTPMTRVVIRPATGASITLTGTLADEIGAASGADVWVRGRRISERSFDVASYAVRSVDGVSAVTGTLVGDGDRLVLVSDDGRRHVIARPPQPLRDQVGARVWISGNVDSGITAYGILRRRR